MDTKRRSYDIYDIEERVHALELGGGSSPSGGSWDYSTDEVDTKQKWIDGKTIYCKVVTGTFTFRQGIALEILADASSIDHVIDFRIADTVNGASCATIQCWIETGKLNAISPYATTASNAIIYYTKVTPAKTTKRSKK